MKFLFLTDCFDHRVQSFLKAVYVIFTWNSFLTWNLTGNQFVERKSGGARAEPGGASARAQVCPTHDDFQKPSVCRGRRAGATAPE